MRSVLTTIENKIAKQTIPTRWGDNFVPLNHLTFNLQKNELTVIIAN